MLKKALIATTLLATSAMAAEVPIVGQVASKCTVYVDTVGVYGNPTPDKLTTASDSGGVAPVIRYDVVNADTYKAKITTPTEFSSSPTLDDVLSWTGSTSVSRMSDAGMASYDTDKVEYDSTTEYTLSVAGSTWFESESVVEYGYGKSLPGGTYKAVVTAECVAL
jgi:hypothetical protein